MREIIRLNSNEEQIKQKKRVAAYARVSMESERLMHSLSVQVGYYSDLIQKNPDWIYAGVYADEGITGTQKEKRNEFKRMIKDCENGKIDIILVKSISRFARNTVDLLDTVRYLKSMEIEVRFEKEGINSLSNDGELMLSILASFAQEESRSISDNVKWGTRKRFEQGIPNGRIRVYGYRWENDVLITEPAEAEIVKRIYNEYLNGSTPRKIADSLNEEKIFTINGCKWCDFNIRYMLKNIIYTGNMLLQKSFVDDHINKKRKQNNGELPKYLVENNHEAVIDKDIFDRVQNELKKRSKSRKSVFAQKLKCGICGERYVRNTCGKPPYKLWVCKTKKNCGYDVCSGINIKEERLKELLSEVLGLDEFNDEFFDMQVKNIIVSANDTIQIEFYEGHINKKKVCE